MRCREKRKRVGDVLPVRDSYHYPLPSGLAPGTLVKLIAFDHGFWTVEANGEQFSVFLTLIDGGHEYEWRGRWLSEDDPRVVAERKEMSLAGSPAISCVNGGCVSPPLPA